MKNLLIYKVLFAIVLAVLAGIFIPPATEIFGVPVLKLFGLFGQLFLNALNLVVVPLVVASIVTGSARMGADHSFGPLGLRTLGYFVLTCLLAVLTGLTLTLILQPGAFQGASISLDAKALADLQAQSQGGGFGKIEMILLKIIPSNILAAAAQSQMLGIILFSMVFGFLTSKIDSQYSTTILNFFKGLFQIMMQMTQLVMKALPIGVFALVAKAIASTGIETIGSVAYFFGTVLLGLLIYAGILLPALLKFAGGVNPWAHIRAMFPALVTAFSTSSSAATLPVTLECVEKRAGVSNRVSSFVVPLGTSVTSGSALYVCVAVLFIAQVYGLQIGIPGCFVVVLMTMLTALATGGIPSASLISVVIILQALGLPADGIGLIMAVERILDMFRTPVNVFGTSCCAVLAARGEGEKTFLATAKS